MSNRNREIWPPHNVFANLVVSTIVTFFRVLKLQVSSTHIQSVTNLHAQDILSIYTHLPRLPWCNCHWEGFYTWTDESTFLSNNNQSRLELIIIGHREQHDSHQPFESEWIAILNPKSHTADCSVTARVSASALASQMWHLKRQYASSKPAEASCIIRILRSGIFPR